MVAEALTFIRLDRKDDIYIDFSIPFGIYTSVTQQLQFKKVSIVTAENFSSCCSSVFLHLLFALCETVQFSP